jgi:hypothetical protein
LKLYGEELEMEVAFDYGFHTPFPKCCRWIMFPKKRRTREEEEWWEAFEPTSFFLIPEVLS